MNYNFPVEKKDIYVIENDRKIKVNRRKALVRTDTEKVLSIVSDNYRIITHEEVFDPFLNLGEKIISYENSAWTADEAVYFMNFKIPHKAPFEPKLGDVTEFKLRAFNSYTRATPAGFELFGYRLVCKNGLAVPKRLVTYTFKHRNNEAEVLEENILKAIDNLKQIENLWKNWGETKHTEKELNNYISSLDLPEEKIEHLTDKFKESKNLWDLFNVLTHYTSHEINTRGKNAVANKREKTLKLQNHFYSYWN